MDQIAQKIKSSTQKAELKKFIKWFVPIGLFMAMGGWLTTYTQLLEVSSHSLEGIHYLLMVKGASMKRGDIVSIQGHTPQYIGNYNFTKRVIGLPRDQIIKTQNHLTLKAQNGAFSITLPLLTQTKEGQPLTPLSHDVVPEGHIFVIGDHLRSFDSRYEEFGLVALEKIYGKGVFTW